jgi:hypothetical protein
MQIGANEASWRILSLLIYIIPSICRIMGSNWEVTGYHDVYRRSSGVGWVYHQAAVCVAGDCRPIPATPAILPQINQRLIITHLTRFEPVDSGFKPTVPVQI